MSLPTSTKTRVTRPRSYVLFKNSTLTNKYPRLDVGNNEYWPTMWRPLGFSTDTKDHSNSSQTTYLTPRLMFLMLLSPLESINWRILRLSMVSSSMDFLFPSNSHFQSSSTLHSFLIHQEPFSTKLTLVSVVEIDLYSKTDLLVCILFRQEKWHLELFNCAAKAYAFLLLNIKHTDPLEYWPKRPESKDHRASQFVEGTQPV